VAQSTEATRARTCMYDADGSVSIFPPRDPRLSSSQRPPARQAIRAQYARAGPRSCSSVRRVHCMREICNRVFRADNGQPSVRSTVEES